MATISSVYSNTVLQLSTQNVHTLLYGEYMASIITTPEFVQLLDDDIVSLIALTLIVDPKCRLQGWRHGFESGGGQLCQRSEQKKLFDPPLFGQWGGKILLRQLSQPNSFV